jgi:hypothetical protein
MVEYWKTGVMRLEKRTRFSKYLTCHSIIPLFPFIFTIFNLPLKVQPLLELPEESVATRRGPSVTPPYLPSD